MTDRRADDTSDLPAACREPDHHRHPLPGGFRVLLALYGLVILALCGAFVLALEQGRDDSERSTERTRMEITRIIDSRTAERKVNERKQQAEIDAAAVKAKADNAAERRLVCAVLTDLPATANVAALGRQLRCP